MSVKDTPPLSPSPQVWRSGVRAGEWFYVWSRARNVGGDASLVNATGVIPLAPFAPGWFRPPGWFDDLDRGFVVPDGTPPGTYTLTIGGKSAGPLTVFAPLPTIAWTLLSPVPPLPGLDDGQRIASALAVGHVQLNPGEYRIRKPFAIPADHTIRGRGAVVIGSAPLKSSYANSFLFPGDRVRFEGLTFENATVGDNGCQVFGPPDAITARNVTVSGCTFRGCAFGAWVKSEGLLVERCTFDRGSLDTYGGMYLGNEIRGICPVGHSFICQALTSPLAVIDLLMDGTDRGLNLRPMGSNIDNCLLACCDFRHVRQTQNGDELLNTETNDVHRSFSNNILRSWRSSSTDGSVQFTPVCKNNLVQSCDLDASLFLWGPCEGNEFLDVRLRGSIRVRLSETAKNNTLIRFMVNYESPSWENQHAGGAWVPAAIVEAAGPDAASNVLRSPSIFGSSQAIPATVGFTVQR